MAGPKNPSAPKMCANTYWNSVLSHCSGFQVGVGDRKIGSSVPNARHSTTYSGRMNSRISQTIPGKANAGQ